MITRWCLRFPCGQGPCLSFHWHIPTAWHIVVAPQIFVHWCRQFVCQQVNLLCVCPEWNFIVLGGGKKAYLWNHTGKDCQNSNMVVVRLPQRTYWFSLLTSKRFHFLKCTYGTSPMKENEQQEKDELELAETGFPGGSVLKNPATNAGGTGSILESRRSPGGGNGSPRQHSHLGNPMDRGAALVTVRGAAKALDTSQRLKQQQRQWEGKPCSGQTSAPHSLSCKLVIIFWDYSETTVIFTDSSKWTNYRL